MAGHQDFMIQDPFSAFGHDQGQHQNGGNKGGGKDGSKIEVAYEGWTLVRAKPLPDEKPSWSRIRKTQLPGDGQQLEKMAKRHRERTGRGPLTTFEKDLSSTQQKVINRLLDDRRAQEKEKKAEWVLHCIKKDLDKKFFGSVECSQITVIMKRQDRQLSKPKPAKEKVSDEDDIIDIKLKPAKKEKSGQQGKKDGNQGGHGGHGQNHFNQHPAVEKIVEVPMPPQMNDHGIFPDLPPMPGAIHVDDWNNRQHPQGQQQWPQQGHVQHHPFTPYPAFDHPSLYPEQTHQGPFQQDPIYRARSQVRMGEGEAMHQRASSHDARRHIRRVENQVKDINEQNEHLHDKIDTMMDALNLHGEFSSDGSDHTDFWGTGRHAYSTPASSPPRSPRLGAGALIKRRPSHRLLRHPRRYSEAVVMNGGRRRFDDERPRLFHASTYNDYPHDPHFGEHVEGYFDGHDRRREYHPRRATTAGRPYDEEWDFVDERRGRGYH